MYRADLKDSQGDFYVPQLRIGFIVWSIIVSFIPILNTFLAVFEFTPKILIRVFTWIDKFLNTPLVPKKVKKRLDKAS